MLWISYQTFFKPQFGHAVTSHTVFPAPGFLQYSTVTALVRRYSCRASSPGYTYTCSSCSWIDIDSNNTVCFVHSYQGLFQTQTVWSLQREPPHLSCCRCWRTRFPLPVSRSRTWPCWYHGWRLQRPGQTRCHLLCSELHLHHWWSKTMVLAGIRSYLVICE